MGVKHVTSYFVVGYVTTVHPYALQPWASVGGGACPPWIFKHGTNIVDRGFFAIFGLFFVAPPSRKRLNSAIFGIFLLIFGLFPFLPLPAEKFFADALACNVFKSKQEREYFLPSKTLSYINNCL